ncbi:MAG TPA: SOS response-associated peptidase [Anaerolineaceae bacterium]
MCGRFTLTLEADDIREILRAGDIPVDYSVRFNIAPTQSVAVIKDTSRDITMMRWGLVPSWAKDIEIGSRLINARSETVMEKPSFRQSFLRRRCLILADGFYEWKRAREGSNVSQPYYFRLHDQKLFGFAGLWDAWKATDGTTLMSCTILTCPANDVVRQVHERMPVILSSDWMWEWLQPQSPDRLLPMLRPYKPEETISYPVSKRVNIATIDGPELIVPLSG